MDLMISTISCGNSLLSRLSSHFLCTGSTSSDTWDTLGSSYLSWHGIRKWGMGSHISSHILTLYPLPILHWGPYFKRLIPALRFLQAREGLWPSFASKKVPLAKYFGLSIWVGKESGLVSTCQPCLARNAKLKLLKFLNPNPSWSLGLLSLSHLTQ